MENHRSMEPKTHLRSPGKASFSSRLLEEASKIASGRVFYFTCLALISLLAFTVRILPLKWGAYLSEFDPYWHWYVADHIVNNGPSFMFDATYIDSRTWYPYGRVVAPTTPMGLPFTAAVFYFFLKGLGIQVSLLDVTIYLPPCMAALTSVAVFFLGKDLGGREVGLLAGFFLALNNAYISRTTLGFFKHESVGILAIVIVSLFFLRSIDPKKSLRESLAYAVAAGLALAYLNISWGAFYFMLGLIPLYAFITMIVRGYRPRLFISYVIAMGLSIAIAAQFPNPGYSMVTSANTLPVLGGFIVLATYEALRRVGAFKLRLWVVLLSLGVAVAGAAVLYQMGYVVPIAGKFLSVINPSLKMTSPAGPIVESVAEHRISTWASFYYGYGNLLFLAPLGFYFALRRRRLSDIYLTVFGVVSLYFAASFIRLTLIQAPAFCLLAAYGVVGLARPMMEAVKGLGPRYRGKGIVPAVNPRLGLVFIILLIVILTPTFLKAIDGAYSPVTIASCGSPLREFRGDWLEALSWIQHNVPPGVPVVCWWDYGYWVAIAPMTLGEPSNATSVADNATLDTEKIADVGQVLLSEESKAFELSRKYFKTDYILVYVTTAPAGELHQPWGYGDEGKWIWMAEIAHGYHPEINRTSVDKNGDGFPDGDTLLGKAILYAAGRPVEWNVCNPVFVSSSHAYVETHESKPTTQVIILKGVS